MCKCQDDALITMCLFRQGNCQVSSCQHEDCCYGRELVRFREDFHFIFIFSDNISEKNMSNCVLT